MSRYFPQARWYATVAAAICLLGALGIGRVAAESAETSTLEDSAPGHFTEESSGTESSSSVESDMINDTTTPDQLGPVLPIIPDVDVEVEDVDLLTGLVPIPDGDDSAQSDQRPEPVISANDKDELDLDIPPSTPNDLGFGFYAGGRTKLDFQSEGNFDLDSRTDDGVTTIDPAVSLAISYMPNRYVLGYLSLELSREFDIDDDADRNDSANQLKLRRAYIQISELIDGTTLTLGRQKIRDRREWYIDDELDAVRLEFEKGPVSVEAVAGREEFADPDLLENDEVNRINTYILSGEYDLARSLRLAAFALFRDDRSGRKGRVGWLGLRARGRLDLGENKLNYWVDIATRQGRSRLKRVDGYGFDAGATFTADHRLDPHVTIAAAHGSGDSDRSDDRDTEFRQTGLEDNEYTFGGVTRFKYYGEVFDPDLRNIHIYTVGTGFRPTDNSSVDIVYHYYRQDKLSDRLVGSPIDLDPNSDPSMRSRSLGQEIDLIVGMRDITPNFDVDFTFGYFFPGDAFRLETSPGQFAGADGAYFAGLMVRYNF